MLPSVKSCNIEIFAIKGHFKYLKLAFFAELKSFVTFHTVFMMYLFRFTESQNSKLLRRLLFYLQVTKEKIFKMIRTVQGSVGKSFSHLTFPAMHTSHCSGQGPTRSDWADLRQRSPRTPWGLMIYKLSNLIFISVYWK